MSRRARSVHLILFLAALWGLNFGLTGSWQVEQGDGAIWFHAGLPMLIVGMYWIEHFFTRPADVVINALVVFVSVSTLNDPPHPSWWDALRNVALGLAVVVGLDFGCAEAFHATEVVDPVHALRGSEVFEDVSASLASGPLSHATL